MAWAIWLAFFACLALVPDEKPLRLKLVALQACLLLAGLRAAWDSARGERSFARTPADLAIAAWACLATLFWLSSPEPAASTPELSRALACSIAFATAAQSAARLERPHALSWLWAAAAAAAGLHAGHQMRFGGIARPHATFGNPIFLGQALAAGAACTFALAWSEPRRWARAALGALLAPQLLGLWLSQSRAAFAALAAALGFWTLLRAPRGRRLPILAGLACAGAWLFFHFRGRASTHALIWDGAARMWLEHPWFGVGLGRFHLEFPEYAPDELRALWPKGRVIVNYAHNEYLQLLAETGVVGLLAFLAAPLALARRLARAPSSPRAAAADPPALAAAALLAGAFVSPDLRFGVASIVLFAALGFAGGARLAEWSSWSGVPRRWRAPAVAGALLSLLAWAGLAAQPLLAERALQAKPEFPDPADGRSAAAPSRDAEAQGYFYARRADWPRAIESFERAAALEPTRPGPFNNLGNVYYTLGQLPRAETYWRRSVAVAPDQADAHLNLAKLLYERGDLKQAASHAQAALRARPGDEKARVLLKRILGQ